MTAAVALSLVALLSAHVPGVSQGDVVVDGAGRAFTVEVDVVFARGDAARLPSPFVVVTAGGDACIPDPAAAGDAVDVEGDGRALRVLARCAGDGDVVVDVVGLRALPPEHRMALRVVDDAGNHDFVLLPADTAATLSRPRVHPRPPAAAVALAVAAVVVGFGARRPRAFAATLGLALLGAGVTLLARPWLVGVADVDVAAVVRVAVAALAVAGVALDPTPRARVAALALGALAAA